ncbi:MAG: hypothetical protein JWQ72_416 [Polaromonas sp.]|nr:hypothetical protein [Polaromonas sp.]
MAALPTWLHVSDLQGLAQLATQGVLGAAGLAESVQGNVYKAVAATLPLGSRFVDRNPGSSGIKPLGITGLAYAGVRGITRLAGGTVNAILSRAAPLLPVQASSAPREAMLAAMNGVLGDRLLDTANPLALRMSLRHDGRALELRTDALNARLPHATGKIVVLLHGLCMNDLQWGTRHATALAGLGYTPVCLHYNSGLHIPVNGAQFSALLEQMVLAWPRPVEEVTLLCHSMGGLVARSACHQAEHGGQSWRAKLRHLVFLGTPHHGAPLERLGNWVDRLLGGNTLTRPFANIGRLRSSGITDLRYGQVLVAHADSNDADRFANLPDLRVPLPLPQGVTCFALAATTADKPRDPSDRLAGDGLVPLRSALGVHDEERHRLLFAPENQWIARGLNHMDLLEHPSVAVQLVRWLQKP